MLRPIRHSLLACLLLAACGGDDDAGPPDAGPLENAGFARPTVTTTAYVDNNGVWQEVGPANWSCLNTPSDDVASSVEITLSGEINDFQTPTTSVSDATIELFPGTAIDQDPIATTVGDGDGLYQLTVPIGQKRLAFKMSAENYRTTYLINQYLEPDQAAQDKELKPIADETFEIEQALINRTPTPGRGVVGAAIRDCDGHEVGGAIGTVSGTSGVADHLTDAETFYFSAATASVPVIHKQQTVTNKDGRFLVIQLPPTATAYLQVWGFTADQDPATDEPTLLSELAAPVLADFVVTASLEARRSE
jgi:hypothetical protein